MYKVIVVIALLIGTFSAGFGALVNNVVASVGNYAITVYDIKKMNEFLQITSGLKSDQNNAFRELLYNYGLVYLSDYEDQILVRDQELRNYVDSITNQQSGNQFYREYLEQVKLQYKKNQIIRSILSYDQAMKIKISEEIPEAKMRQFYNQNRSSLIEPPSLDAIVIGVLQPKTSSLDELERFDKNLAAVAEALKKTDDVGAVMAKFRLQFAFESYSGRTGMKNVYDLLKTGFPNEALGIGLAKNDIPGPDPKRPVRIGKGVVYGPMPMVLQGNGKATYLIVKVINRQFEKSMSYEAAKPKIEMKIRDDIANEAFKQYIIEKIASGDITVNILDKKYEGAYNEFVRR